MKSLALSLEAERDGKRALRVLAALQLKLADVLSMKAFHRSHTELGTLNWGCQHYAAVYAVRIQNLPLAIVHSSPDTLWRKMSLAR